MTRPTSPIAKIEHFLVPPRWLFVRIETADGAVGWGEASLEGHAEAVAGALEAVRDRLIGTDAHRIEDAWQTLYRLGFYRGGPVLMSAISGVDQALWDLRGRALGVPVSDLLGGRVRDRIRVYAWIGGDRPSDVAAAARARREQGFDAVKMNGTEDLDWFAGPAAVADAVERLGLVRDTGMDVGVDLHGRVHKPMARQIVRALEPLGPMFIEEPVLSEHPEAIAQLAAQTTVPVALGERLYSRWDFKPFLERGAIDIAQPDLSHAGGISEGRRIAAMAEAYDVALAPHCPLGPLALAACLQVAAAAPNFVIQEMSLGIHYNNAEADLLTYLTDPAVLAVEGGTVAVLEGAGLGVTIDEARVREAAKDAHRWRNPVWRGRDGSLREW
ncbi:MULTISPECIES: galactonate dehydratase [Sphingomonas]|uniref:Galactonate dehydratase n=1 Tax=Sphingomonas adhaesiva TaxID=28212 RepID=A0A2A4I901_9SPHN|nr:MULTISPECIES: galactonate dehydratase [Sphingomonas]PCG14666.1 galactonate dehydratase [Sphingomonas adhaesiva]PZU81709.1 MAG: galactonate dehydratase [Sphingomonas sp.]